LRTTSRGDDKDRVLIRSNEQPTYSRRTSPITRISWSEDSSISSTCGRRPSWLRATDAGGGRVLSGRPETLEVIIGQLVNLLEEGELKQMSTRRGEMVTLSELVEAIGTDAARFFLVMRSHDQTLDLDIGLARKHSQDNPVYYVQYAHARIASILRNAPADLHAGIEPGPGVFNLSVRAGSDQASGAFSAVIQDSADGELHIVSRRMRRRWRPISTSSTNTAGYSCGAAQGFVEAGAVLWYRSA